MKNSTCLAASLLGLATLVLFSTNSTACQSGTKIAICNASHCAIQHSTDAMTISTAVGTAYEANSCLNAQIMVRSKIKNPGGYSELTRTFKVVHVPVGGASDVMDIGFDVSDEQTYTAPPADPNGLWWYVAGLINIGIPAGNCVSLLCPKVQQCPTSGCTSW